MTIYATKGASHTELSVNLGCWVINFFTSLGGLFISLFLLISHDDLQSGCIEPVELSNNLNQFLPWEYFCSILFVIVCMISSPWYVLLACIPLVIINIKKFMQKEYKVYFITRKEYQSQFDKMEMQFKVKSGYYGLLFAISLVMLILTLIDFLGSVI